MFKKKELIKKELELYAREEFLRIDEEIQERKINNWTDLDEVRVKKRDELVEISVEVAKLEAKREFLEELNEIKDKEIETLKTMLSDLINKLS